ncbi:protein disulfide oxidoreductase [Nocardioides aestuarii]|uniref:Redoxin family protein n=1 Tax=Nocardioides aestuarii TaxID=252231 RepID=A0ABW4TLX9_9ACTN
MTRAATLLVLLLTASALTACGEEAEPTAATPAATSTSPEPAPSDKASPEEKKEAEPAAVPDTLDFTATTVGGEELDGATLAGKPVLLWFWAPWCPTCRGQVPQVEGLAADYDGELAVVGVGSLDSAEAIADFAGDVDGVTHLVDTDGVLWKKFGVAEQSSFVLLGADGEVAFEAGYGGSDALGSEVADVIG